MKIETRYKYQKKIRELQDALTKAEGKVYDFRCALSEINNSVDTALAQGKTVIHVVDALRPIRTRMWK